MTRFARAGCWLPCWMSRGSNLEQHSTRDVHFAACDEIAGKSWHSTVVGIIVGYARHVT